MIPERESLGPLVCSNEVAEGELTACRVCLQREGAHHDPPSRGALEVEARANAENRDAHLRGTAVANTQGRKATTSSLFAIASRVPPALCSRAPAKSYVRRDS